MAAVERHTNRRTVLRQLGIVVLPLPPLQSFTTQFKPDPLYRLSTQASPVRPSPYAATIAATINMKPIVFLPALALGAHGLMLPSAALSPRVDVNDILAMVSKLFPVNVTLEAAQDLIAAADQTLADVEDFETTREDLIDGVCGDLLVIFARGTDEPGNVGALVGPPFFAAIEDALGSGHTLAVQGVDDYGATVEGYLEGGDAEGSQEM